MYTIKKVADMAGVSVRTLHYYDDVGLLTPEVSKDNGYRMYSDADIERLQQILFFKELDFGLEEIKSIIDSPGFDRREALTAHKEILIKKKNRLNDLIVTVDKTIDSIERRMKMSKEEMFKSFDMKEIEEHQKKYANEVKEKYGNSDAYRESQEKTSKYSKEDWANVMGRAGEIQIRIAELIDRDPADREVQQAIGEWRQHITESFYNCTPEIFRGLGEMYTADERFTKNIDKYREGLAEFMRDAINIYCDNLENI